MISGLLCSKQNPNENLLVNGEVRGLTFLCGRDAGKLACFLKNPFKEELEGDLYFNEVNLGVLPPEFLSPALVLDGFEDQLGSALAKTKSFVFVDLSYLRKKEAEEASCLLEEKYKKSPILVYVPQCKEGVMSLSFTSTSIDPLECLEPDTNYLNLALDAFVLDLAQGIAPSEGVLRPGASPEVKVEEPVEEEHEPKTEAESLNEAEEKPVEEMQSEPQEQPKRGFKETMKASWNSLKNFLIQDADYLFMALFLALTMALNIIVHYMPKEDTNFPLLCLVLAFVFSLCSAVPSVFVVKDTHSAYSFRAVLSYVLQGIVAILCFSTSLTLTSIADYGAIAVIFPVAFVLSPIATAIGVFLLERKKVAAYFKARKEKKHVS